MNPRPTRSLQLLLLLGLSATLSAMPPATSPAPSHAALAARPPSSVSSQHRLPDAWTAGPRRHLHLPSAAASIYVLDQASNSRPGLRDRLLHRLSDPNVAVLLLCLGTLLLFAECNLPGAILPGALGLLLLLSGVFALTRLPLHPAALLLLAAAIALLAVSARRPAFGVPAVLGTAALIRALSTLFAQPTPPAHPSIAIPLGAAVGIAAALLGRVAWQARRNKALLPQTTRHAAR